MLLGVVSLRDSEHPRSEGEPCEVLRRKYARCRQRTERGWLQLSERMPGGISGG